MSLPTKFKQNSIGGLSAIVRKLFSQPGVGVTKSPFFNFSVTKFSILQQYLLDYLNHIYIWHVSPQLSCGDTYQLWMWYSIANEWFGNAEKFGK